MSSEAPQVEEETTTTATETVDMAPTETSEPVETSDVADDDADDTAEASEVIISIGAPPAPDEIDEEKKNPNWLKDLRKREREQAKRIRELEAAQRQAQPAPVAEKPEPAPQLRDFDWDEDKHREAVSAWATKEAARKHKEAQAADEARKAVEATYATYRAKRDELAAKVPDYDDARDELASIFDIPQQNALLRAADNPALVTYALGKDPKKAREIAAINDPVKFIAALAKLELEVKVSPAKNKTPKPSPDTPVRGANGSPSSKSRDRAIERAQQSGDATEVLRVLRDEAKKK